MGLTITEALAEIKTISKRIEKKRQSIETFAARQEGVRDPLDKEGGSVAFVNAEMQGIADLERRIIALRRGIQHANDTATITVLGDTRTISEWLTWRREIAPGQVAWFQRLRSMLNNLREDAKRKGNAVFSATVVADEAKPSDIVVNINERELAEKAERIEEILGTLDGQLSLKNATVTIDE